MLQSFVQKSIFETLHMTCFLLTIFGVIRRVPNHFQWTSATTGVFTDFINSLTVFFQTQNFVWTTSFIFYCLSVFHFSIKIFISGGTEDAINGGVQYQKESFDSLDITQELVTCRPLICTRLICSL